MIVVYLEGTLQSHSSAMQTPSTFASQIGSAYLEEHVDVGTEECEEGQLFGIRMTSLA